MASQPRRYAGVAIGPGGVLPLGLAMTSGGIIEGILPAPGSCWFSIRLRDASAQVVVPGFDMRVNSPAR